MPMPLWPGDRLIENYSQVLSAGTSTGSTAPVSTMLFNSTVVALCITSGKILISLISAFAIVYFRFPFRMFFFCDLHPLISGRGAHHPDVPVSLTWHVNSYSGLTLPGHRLATPVPVSGSSSAIPMSSRSPRMAVRGRSLLLDVGCPSPRPACVSLRPPFIYGGTIPLPLLITTESHVYLVFGIKRRSSGGYAARMAPCDFHCHARTACRRRRVLLMRNWFIRDSGTESTGRRIDRTSHSSPRECSGHFQDIRTASSW